VAGRRRAPPGYAILIQDITEAAHLTKKLEEVAYTDALTGINNFRHFMILASMQAERMKRAKGSAYIIIFDLDRFKEVNEAHGHAVGDKALKAVANIVHDMVRPYDLFARFGGEEFILFISDIGEKDIDGYAERVRLAVSNNPIMFGDAQLTVTASFGVAPLIPKEGLETAINTANEAMCMAKNEGRNRVVALK
jgi:diguanylate cyclase (GGDEF)-like protein